MTTWVKIYNSMPSHPKLLLAGDRAGWLYLCSLCYSNEHLTDGFVAAHVLPVVAPGVHNPGGLAGRLVKVHLWDRVDGGWQIHGYDRHQRSSDQIRDDRARDAARKRSGKSPPGVRAEKTRTPDHKRVEESREEQREKNTNTSTSSPVRVLFDYWREKCKHPQAKLTSDRRSKLEARLKDGYSSEQIRLAIDGAARSAFVNDAGVRFDDLELICRNGSKLESFIDRPDSNLVRLGGSSHLPENLRVSPEHQAQLEAHIKDPGPEPEWLQGATERMQADLAKRRAAG